MKIITHSPMETIKAAEKLGGLLRAGDMIAYKGRLGAGKTTFTRGIVIGMGLDDSHTSPTFALVNEYPGENITLYHLDMYRFFQKSISLIRATPLKNKPNSFKFYISYIYKL